MASHPSSLPVVDSRPAALSDRSATLKLLLKVHWISAALSLLGMLLFSFTGITLNHAGLIESAPHVVRQTVALPAELNQALLAEAARLDGRTANLAAPAVDWLAERLKVGVGAATGEWAADEIYIALPRPGGDAWLRLGLDAGEVEYEVTDRGWISWLNDLHKGRHTGTAWSWFIDLFALACLLFSLSGLWVLKIHAQRRASTWPLVGLGVLLPVLIALMFIH